MEGLRSEARCLMAERDGQHARRAAADVHPHQDCDAPIPASSSDAVSVCHDLPSMADLR